MVNFIRVITSLGPLVTCNLVVAATRPGSIPTPTPPPLGVRVAPGGSAVWLSLGSLSDQIPTLPSSAHQWCLKYSWISESRAHTTKLLTQIWHSYLAGGNYALQSTGWLQKKWTP